ncbi:MAG: NfeD family protein [Bacteroidia bacterium]|nr:NfeD family protein [Bacteroidia bacterium]
MEFFQNMEPLLRTFWYIALPCSLIFVIQSIMTFMGADATEGVTADFDGDLDGGDTPFQLFSFRNLINFMLGFSWTGISFYLTIKSSTMLIALSTVVGILFVYVFFIIIRQLMKLAEDNSFKMNETVGKTAEVYIRIPENRTGKGKVQVSVRGSVHEIEAITEEGELSSGSIVKITGIENNILIVKK